MAFRFLYPWLLLGLPIVAGFLVYVYRRRGTGKRVVVSSTLILEKLRSFARARNKFIPPPRFFFELFLLFLAVLAASGITFENKSERVALLVDTSFGLKAKLPRVGGSTLFEKGVEDLRHVLDERFSGAKFHVYRTTPEVKLLSSEYVSRNRALALLEEQQPVYGEDNLRGALREVMSAEAYERVLVASDQKVTGLGASAEKVSSHVVQFGGERLENIALTDLLVQSPGKNVEVQARIAAFTEEEVRAALKLERVHLEPSKNLFSFEELAQKSFRILAGESHFETFQIPEMESLLLKVSLQLPREQLGQSAQDSLREDNAAYLVLGGRKQRALIVSDFPKETLLLSGLPGFQFEYVTSQEWQDQTASLVKKAEFIIFHRVRPRTLPDANCLFILPEEGEGMFPVLATHRDVRTTRWQESHPVLRYLRLASLTLVEFARIQAPPWLEEILFTTEGPAVFAGALGEYRYLALGFELFPFRGKESPLMSILTLNAISWLADTPLAQGFTELQQASWSEGAAIQYVVPNVNVGEKAGIAPGIARVKTPDDAEGALVALNFFSEQESNVQKKNEIEIDFPQQVPSGERANSQFYRNVALLLLLLLLFDLGYLVWSRRK